MLFLYDCLHVVFGTIKVITFVGYPKFSVTFTDYTILKPGSISKTVLKSEMFMGLMRTLGFRTNYNHMVYLLVI